ncbi:DUF4097 family beta strand repeat protein [Dactylosporangium aurantiacum]|uniref:DUF4097 family beta strand repeat protein n=1 Tax=Dactylosporangium aurantiacum TaxID=35754 RepID=A0A9Q9ISA5_9ACTN|nr:DUF4097 family beta strand repeat-containing protein [Dactylosporangium aurantiacum]MDG6109925.1 DUF4097 family beta strand repeat-containing protein [Dactylosporangium aurantiacum]UWZ58078.1 DUF4097 family beta strand repeat protein [Dactylosporangium aurantiacum]
MQTFDTPAPISAVLDIPAGRLRFVAGDRPDTTVEVRPADPGKRRDVQVAEQTTVEYAGGVLRITATAKHQILGSSGAIDVTVQLPAGSGLAVTAASADLRAVGRFGDVAYDGAHGAVTLDEATGVRITTHAGDVSVGRLAGPARISTGKGDIAIAEAVHGAVVLRTQAGDVTVGAAPGVPASLDAGTGHGRIRNALMNTSGTAELTIEATTAYGDIAAHTLQ